MVFDTNAPISTQTWPNTIDTPPVSTVSALPPAESSLTLTLSWSGTDVGSGIASYTIFVSDNGGPYAARQTAVTTTSATYTGVVGHTYAFYSIATDRAGNIQAPKTQADTTTTVGTGVTDGPCDVGGYGIVNISDVREPIDEALGIYAANNDMNGDGVVHVIDLQIVMNAALNPGCLGQ